VALVTGLKGWRPGVVVAAWLALPVWWYVSPSVLVGVLAFVWPSILIERGQPKVDNPGARRWPQWRLARTDPPDWMLDGVEKLDLVEKVVTNGIRGSATKVRVQPAYALDWSDMIASPRPLDRSQERIAEIRGEPAR
jgi:hypothetical protein